MNIGCYHSKIGPKDAIEEGRHCAFMTCPNYVSKCPKHAIAKTGDTCNLQVLWIVTIKNKKNPAHDPHNKVTAACGSSEKCTDSTGEHHSFLAYSVSPATLQASLKEKGIHVTRIEAAEATLHT
jgi:hypothetical protein